MVDEENTTKNKGVLLPFMSCTNGMWHKNDHEFTVEELAPLTAAEAWFNFKARGTPTPGMNDQPTHGRSNSLLHCEKCISFFVPLQNHQWNELTNLGNPTRHQAINDLIKQVWKFEMCQQGATLKACQPS